jgi:hypothetical protein
MADSDEPYDAPDEQPKIEAAAVAYGWIKHLAEVAAGAADDLAAYVPDDQEQLAVERARARAAAMLHAVEEDE